MKKQVRNFLKETLEVLKAHGKTLDDIEWIGGFDFCIDRAQFEKLADVEYNPGYGHQEVAKDIQLVGKDFWLERREYDGSEWWEYKAFPRKPAEVRSVSRIVGGYWDTLKWMNEENEDEVE